GADYKPEIKVSLPDLKSVLRPCRVNVIDDSIVVTDYLNHCFKFFDSDLNECQKVIGRLGFDIGEFRYPTGITQGAGCLYATDIRSGRVTKISSDEECIEFLAGHQGAAMSPDSAGFLASFDQTKEAGDMIYLATDIAVDEQQNVYVADIGHQAVLKFDQQGRYLGKIGYGVLAVENKTSFIGCEIYSGVLYVTNPANSCVNIFDLNGNCLDCIEPLVDGLSLQCPTGISVSHSLIAIADRLNHRIVLVRRDDRSVFSIGKLGNQTRQFCAPWDVALIEESLVVVDSLNNRLQKISL
ncbi:MAG: NHL repeat-containing protein, partial [Planctomycetaceae bacterium]|nr:NHL repeat-containing protein [Planctomycetaceae bacterium]